MIYNVVIVFFYFYYIIRDTPTPPSPSHAEAILATSGKIYQVRWENSKLKRVLIFTKIILQNYT